MASLYELSASYSTLLGMYDLAETDEEREEVLKLLATADGDISEKAEAYARIIKNKEAEADGLKKEADRLTKRKRVAENIIARLKAAMLDAMKLTSQTEIQTGIGKWRVQTNPWSCDVVDIDDVPQEYHVHQPDVADKKAILDYFKQTGEIVPGVTFKQELGVRFR